MRRLLAQPPWLVRALDLAVRARGRVLRVLPPRSADDPYRRDARRTYPFGYSPPDLGPRERSHELHRDAQLRGA